MRQTFWDRARGFLLRSAAYRAALPAWLLLELFAWRLRRREGPAPRLVKHRLVRKIAAKQGLRVLVETGTYLGTMVAAVQDRFDAVFTIELDPVLAAHATERFARLRHVSVVQGDSAVELVGVLNQVAGPALFWLDAHFSGGITANSGPQQPITREIELIALHRLATSHSLLIDDARHFTGKAGYPSTAALFSSLGERFPAHSVAIEGDIVIVTPRQTGSQTG